MKVIISIPAYNEERTIGRVIDEINQVMTKTNYNYQIVVYNDGSIDNTEKIAKAHGAKVFSHKINRGLAITFQDEIKELIKLKADVIVHTDADGQYKAKHIPELISKVEQGYDLVLGSRFKKGPSYLPFLKEFGNKAFAKVLTKMINVPLTDTTTGYRAFTLDIAKEIKFINSFTYTQEQLIRASKQGFKIIEIPIESRKTRASKLFKSPLQYAFKAWINILRIYRDYDPIKFFGSAGLLFLILGFLLGLFIIAKVIMTGTAGGVPRVILTALFFFTGVQLISFGFLADMNQK
jgi:glycosyltransferase involved in cell wall biosynthesis